MELIKTISRPGKMHNEDLLKHGPNFVLVLDGSTGLRKNLINNSFSDAIWYVNKISDYIVRNIDKSTDLKKLLKDSIRYVIEEYNSLGINISDKIDYPSASLVLLKESDEMVELINIGDCTTLLETSSNKLIRIYDDSVSKLDNSVVSKMKNLSFKLNVPVSDTRELVKQHLIDNRYKKNTHEGYWILGFDEEAINKSTVSTWNKAEIKNICIFTDGFADYYETLNIVPDHNKFYTCVKNTDVEILYKTLRDVQLNDENCTQHPRLKSSDDATLVLLEI